MFAKLFFRERRWQRGTSGKCRVGHTIIPTTAGFGSVARPTPSVPALIAISLRSEFLRNVDDFQLLLLKNQQLGRRRQVTLLSGRRGRVRKHRRRRIGCRRHRRTDTFTTSASRAHRGTWAQRFRRRGVRRWAVARPDRIRTQCMIGHRADRGSTADNLWFHW